MSHIQIKNLTKKFDAGSGRLTVVDNISFDVMDGEFVCLLGPSGSGKSVTLNCIAGLLDATHGEIKVGGMPVSEKKPDPGFISPKQPMITWRTVEETLTT